MNEQELKEILKFEINSIEKILSLINTDTTPLLILGFIITLIITFWRTAINLWIYAFFLLFILWFVGGILAIIKNAIKPESTQKLQRTFVKILKHKKEFLIDLIEMPLYLFYYFFLSFSFLAVITLLIVYFFIGFEEFLFLLPFSILLFVITYLLRREKINKYILNIMTDRNKEKNKEKLEKIKKGRGTKDLLLIIGLSILLVVSIFTLFLFGILNIGAYINNFGEIMGILIFMFIFIIVSVSYFNKLNVITQLNKERLELKGVMEDILSKRISMDKAIEIYKNIKEYEIIVDSLLFITFYIPIPKPKKYKDNLH